MFKVGLVQINNSYCGQSYFPYSVGLLQSYALKYLKKPDNYEFFLPIFSRVSVASAIEVLKEADLVAFSTYVWNFKLSLEIARTLKYINPEVLIIFGGPQVPNLAEDFLKRNSFIDICCHGEGEQVFTLILEELSSRNFQNIPAVSFFTKDGNLINNPRMSRIKDLTKIPSPYLEGIFDDLIKNFPDKEWIGLWETNRGCPFSCTYCDWGSATQSKVYTFDLERLFREIEWFAKNRVSCIYCCDANFGILPRDLEIIQYIVKTKEKFGYPSILEIQSTKNATERSYEVQKILAASGLNNNQGITLAMQSLDLTTLKNIKRHNISLDSYKELQRRFQQDGLQTYSDIIIGLPGETYDSFANGINSLIESGQHSRIPFNNLSILPNAEIADISYRDKYNLLTVETEMISLHSNLNKFKNDVIETQELVIGTITMPPQDWCKARVFAWAISLLYFDKLLQIPFIVLHEVCSISYRDLVELFLNLMTNKRYPVISEINDFLFNKASNLKIGGAEYCPSESWLNIWWPVDEYLLIKLVTENKIALFYDEAENLLLYFLEGDFFDMQSLLHQSISLSRKLLKLPFQKEIIMLECSYNIWEFYRATLRGISIPLNNEFCKYQIDCSSKTWNSYEEWYSDLIWGVEKGHIDQNKNLMREAVRV